MHKCMHAQGVLLIPVSQVTGDQDLLVIETSLPVRILTAREALLEIGFAINNVTK